MVPIEVVPALLVVAEIQLLEVLLQVVQGSMCLVGSRRWAEGREWR